MSLKKSLQFPYSVAVDVQASTVDSPLETYGSLSAASGMSSAKSTSRYSGFGFSQKCGMPQSGRVYCGT